MTAVSIVVPTRNSARTLEPCLRSIRAQTYEDVELVVVDNHSSDETPAVAKRLSDRFLTAGPERSSQRNHGARIATGSALIFVDSDMLLEPTIVAECVAALEDGARAVVIPERSFGDGFWARCKALERSCYVGDPTIEAARCFVRELFDQVGGYDGTLIAGEDWDLHERARETGAEIGRTSAFIWHDEGRLRLLDSATKKFRYGQTLGRYVDKHPKRARSQLQLIRPAYIRHRKRLAREPLTTAGMIALKASEAAAGAAGLVIAKLR
jgi:glycosyltransferase involved in cell wall biosynthesis